MAVELMYIYKVFYFREDGYIQYINMHMRGNSHTLGTDSY